MPAPGSRATAAIARRSASGRATLDPRRRRSAAHGRLAARGAPGRARRPIAERSSWPSSRESSVAALPRQQRGGAARAGRQPWPATTAVGDGGRVARRARPRAARARSGQASSCQSRRCVKAEEPSGRSGGQIPQQRIPARARWRPARSGAPSRARRPPAGAGAAGPRSARAARPRGPRRPRAGTSSPSSPSATMSDGPRGQSKLTTGRPLPIASTSTMPNPSKREESANSDASAIAAPSARVRPSSHAPGRPARRSGARARRARGPEP